MLSDHRTAGGVRPSPIFFALLATTVGAGYLTTLDIPQPRLAVFVFVISAWVLSVVFHEFAHAYLAWRGGDTSVVRRGYLTLDPRHYAHPVLSIGLPVLFMLLGGIGLPGGAVVLNRGALSDGRATLVALAGPLTNLGIGAACLIALDRNLAGLADQTYLSAAVGFLGFLQITVFLLNILPVPGLDGYAAIEPALPPQTRELMRPVARYGVLLMVVFIFYVEPVSAVFWDVVLLLTGLFGVEIEQWRCGFHLFRFWDGGLPPTCSGS